MTITIDPPRHVGVILKTTKVAAVDFAFMVAAVAIQAREHLCPPWGIDPVEVAAYTDHLSLPDSVAGVIFLVDDDGNADSLGYHTQIGTRVFGFVDVGQTLAGGGCVSAVLSHEVLEMILDQNIDTWTPGPDGNDWAVEACLAGDTAVHLADGTVPTIRELASRGFGAVEIIAVDRDGMRIPVHAVGARLTRRNAETVVVRLTDGNSFRCTPDHRVMMSDGSYRQAQTLSPGEYLSQVGPGPALPDSINGANIQAKASGDDSRNFFAFANVADVSVAQLGVPVILASPVSVPAHSPLGGGVVHVVAMGANEEVGRVGTDGIVARVANEHPRRDRPDVAFIRKPVDIMGLPAEANLSISSGIGSAGPTPATISADNPQRINFLRRAWNRLVVALESVVRIAVSFHSSPVETTPSASDGVAFTARDRAYLHAKTIHSVECAGKCDVYDLNVPGLHNFAIGAGVFVHNCDPCEEYAYHTNVEIAGEKQLIEVSDFVLPGYFEAGHGDADHMRLIDTWTLSPGGYQIARKPSGEIIYLAPETAAKKLARKLSRTVRRT